MKGNIYLINKMIQSIKYIKIYKIDFCIIIYHKSEMIHKRKYIIRVKRIIPFNISYELIDYSEKGNISKDKKELI